MISRSAGIFRQAAGIAAAVFFASLLVGVMAPAPATAGDGHTVVHCLDDNLGTVRKTLATDCKGRAVTEEEAAAVKNQRRDYIQKVLSKVPDSSMESKSFSRLGSGFFVAEDGSVLTRHHLVDGCSSISVALDLVEIQTTTVTAPTPEAIQVLHGTTVH